MTSAAITRRKFLSFAGGAAVAGAVPGSVRAAAKPQAGKLPNIVIIFTDDQGYQDVGCFGSPKIKTPNLDRMAREGMKFTDFYVAQPVCGASRAALLTGCYPNRIGMLGAPSHRAMHGISPKEMLIPELVKQKGYATAMYGKWHLGHRPESLPPSHGFDDYFGLPYSNDMWPFHPTAGRNYPPLPLIEGTKTIRTNPDQSQLTTWYTERGVKFIRKNKDRPFFLYIAHNMPHVPLFVSDKQKGKSARGLYGDVIAEIDWCVGQVLGTLKDCGIDKNTLVIFTSDNGPWMSYGDHGGCALPLREGKGTTWDGGVREPTIMRWPAGIPAGSVCKEPAMTIDIFPTIAGLIGGKLPDHKIDGMDIGPLLSGKAGAKSPHDAFYFYWGKHLQAVRMGKWKLHFPHAYRTMAGKPGGTGGKPTAYSQGKTGLALYDLQADIGETTDVKDKHPGVVNKIMILAEKIRKDIGDSATKQKGANCREPQRFSKPTT
jgi:arylsulfatase A